jgi:hypothetical protein
MKIEASLIALTLLSGATALAALSSAYAAAPPATAPSPAPATSAPMAPKAPGSSNTPVPKPSLKDCNQQADAKDLTGKDRATFVKSCQAGKTGPDG